MLLLSDSMNGKRIVEKKLGIPGSYQYKAIRSKNFMQSNWHNNKLTVIEKVVKLTGARSVLDLGTGSGNFELIFAKKLDYITGVDYNNEAINFLRSKLRRKKIRNVKLICENVLTLSKRKIPEKFDLIISVDVIEHLKKKDAKIFIKSLKKFLNSLGTVCIVTPNYKSPWVIIEKVLDRFTSIPNMENEQHLTKFDKESLERLFKMNGYETTFSKSFNLVSFLPPGKKFASFLCKLELFFGITFGNLLVIAAKNLKSKKNS